MTFSRHAVEHDFGSTNLSQYIISAFANVSLSQALDQIVRFLLHLFFSFHRCFNMQLMKILLPAIDLNLVWIVLPTWIHGRRANESIHPHNILSLGI